MAGLKIKRVYDDPGGDDGTRVLVDRLWPRGLSKNKARVDLWLKDIAPSDELRKWFAHAEEKWDEFTEKYSEELASKPDLIRIITQKSKTGNITLVYAAKNKRFNNAVALKEYIEKTQGS